MLKSLPGVDSIFQQKSQTLKLTPLSLRSMVTDTGKPEKYPSVREPIRNQKDPGNEDGGTRGDRVDATRENC